MKGRAGRVCVCLCVCLSVCYGRRGRSGLNWVGGGGKGDVPSPGQKRRAVGFGVRLL